MDTQNTPVHIKLWHRGFWFLAMANMLLTMSVYMLIPFLPKLLFGTTRFSALQIGLVMGVYGVGIYLFGPFCSYWVQRYRRNRVCVYSIFGVILSVLGIMAAFHYMMKSPSLFFILMALRVTLGASFGLAQMILTSTLIVDTSESFQRTEANHSAAWFGRFALSLGPVAAIVLSIMLPVRDLFILIAVLAFSAIIFIDIVKFPFRAPDENVSLVSLDRFFLSEGCWLYLNLVLITTVIGLLLSIPFSAMFYSVMMAGFLLALLAERFVFVNADLKSEVITGLFMIGVAILLMIMRHQAIVTYVSPLFIGAGIGIIGSRFLLFFIKLSRHCQRGTSQSTYFLAWETGIAVGLFIGIGLLHDNIHILLVLSFLIIVISLMLYNFVVHPWYMKHRNR